MSFTAAGDPRSPWPFGDPVATALLGLLEVELRGHGLHWRVAAPERLEVFREGAPRPGRMIEVSALRGRMARGAKADWPDLVEAAVADWLAEPERVGRGASAGPGGHAAPSGQFGMPGIGTGTGTAGTYGAASGQLGAPGISDSYGAASGQFGTSGAPGTYGAASGQLGMSGDRKSVV